MGEAVALRAMWRARCGFRCEWYGPVKQVPNERSGCSARQVLPASSPRGLDHEDARTNIGQLRRFARRQGGLFFLSRFRSYPIRLIVRYRAVIGAPQPETRHQLSFTTRKRLHREDTLMYISLQDSCEKGFKKWSDAHQPISSTNVAPGDAIVIAGLVTPPELPHGPWLVPGQGNTF